MGVGWKKNYTGFPLLGGSFCTAVGSEMGSGTFEGMILVEILEEWFILRSTMHSP